MNKRFVRAALTACLLGTAAIAAATVATAPAFAAKGGPGLSPAVAKLLQPAAKALEAKDFATADGLVKQAQAVSPQTPFDTYTINNFAANVALGTNDYAAAEVAYDAMADSSAMPDDEKPTTLRNATLLAAQNKHYDRVSKYGTAFLALGTPDPKVIAVMGEGYYYSNDFTNALAYAQKSIDATPAGQAPSEEALEIKMSSQYKLKQDAAGGETRETLVTWYNNSDSWGELIDLSLVRGSSNVELLHVYRLRLASKATGQDEDFRFGANVAQQLGYPGEAQAFLRASKIGGGDPQVKTVNAAAASDRAMLPQLEKIARTGSADAGLKLAETYYGYGRYADAEAAARAALAKGGKLDTTEAQMLIGESLLGEGKQADAQAAFAAVHASTPGWTKALHVWTLFANRKYDATTPSQ